MLQSTTNISISVYMMNAEDIIRCSVGCEIMLMIKARIRLILSSHSLSYFLSLVPCLKFHLRNVVSKQVTDISLILKDSDMESENLSSLIWLSVSDGQKTDRSNDVSCIDIK